MTTHTDGSAAVDPVATRLAKLRHDYDVGSNQLRELAQQQTALRETLLRISGAIQILEELTAEQPASSDGDNGSDTLRVP